MSYLGGIDKDMVSGPSAHISGFEGGSGATFSQPGYPGMFSGRSSAVCGGTGLGSSATLNSLYNTNTTGSIATAPRGRSLTPNPSQGSNLGSTNNAILSLLTSTAGPMPPSQLSPGNNSSNSAVFPNSGNSRVSSASGGNAMLANNNALSALFPSSGGGNSQQEPLGTNSDTPNQRLSSDIFGNLSGLRTIGSASSATDSTSVMKLLTGGAGVVPVSGTAQNKNDYLPGMGANSSLPFNIGGLSPNSVGFGSAAPPVLNDADFPTLGNNQRTFNGVLGGSGSSNFSLASASSGLPIPQVSSTSVPGLFGSGGGMSSGSIPTSCGPLQQGLLQTATSNGPSNGFTGYVPSPSNNANVPYISASTSGSLGVSGSGSAVVGHGRNAALLQQQQQQQNASAASQAATATAGTAFDRRNFMSGFIKAGCPDSQVEFQINKEDFPALQETQSDQKLAGGETEGESKYPGDQTQSIKQQQGIQISPDGTVSNVPNEMIKDQFGMVGMLAWLRAIESDQSIVSLALGTELTALGLNLSASEKGLFRTFAGPWMDLPCRPQDIDVNVPPEYITNCVIRDRLAPIKLNRYGDDLLFFIFYNCCGDLYQLAAAAELYNRDWRFFKQERLWVTRGPSSLGQIDKTETFERGTYYAFDPTQWRKVTKELVLPYDHLEGQPTLDNSASYASASGNPYQQQPQQTIPQAIHQHQHHQQQHLHSQQQRNSMLSLNNAMGATPLHHHLFQQQQHQQQQQNSTGPTSILGGVLSAPHSGSGTMLNSQ